MARGRQKKKTNKRPKSPTIVSSTTKRAETAPLPPGVAKLQPNRTVFASKETFIVAPVETCFGMIAGQLEQPCQWDPILFNALPVSDARGKIGATSQVILDLGGRKVDSQAMISRYHPNRAISWVLTRKPKVREDWRLEQKPRGTVITVTLACEIPGWVIGRLLYKVMRSKKVEQDLDKMLVQLKAVAESTSRD